MDDTVRLEDVPSIPLAVVRRRAAPHELARVVPEACGLVWNALRQAEIDGAGRHVALYWDDVIHLDVGVELDAPFDGCGEVVAAATPAGPAAVVTHFGPYGNLHEAHEAIRRWCLAHGRRRAGPRWEIYGHWTAECDRDPSKIRTEVFHLLR